MNIENYSMWDFFFGPQYAYASSIRKMCVVPRGSYVQDSVQEDKNSEDDESRRWQPMNWVKLIVEEIVQSIINYSMDVNSVLNLLILLNYF